MSQISPPIRIVIVAAVALLGAWMLFLRPKAEPSVPPPAPAPATAPGVKGLTSAVDKAKEASKTSDAANAKIQSATGEESAATAKPAGQAAAKGAATKAAGGTAKGLPARVQKGIDAKKIVVLYFFNPKSADDRFVKRSLAKVDRWGGQVVVQAANVSSVSRYGKIARGADVEQSPTIVVVDRNLKAEKLVGVQDTVSIDQAVVDAMRNSGGIIEDKYLSAINAACATAGVQAATIPDATAPSDIRPNVARRANVWERFMTRFAAIKAPGKWKGLKRASLKDGKAMSANYTAWLGALGSKPSAGRAIGTVPKYSGREHKLTKSWNARMDKHNVLSCGAQT